MKQAYLLRDLALGTLLLLSPAAMGGTIGPDAFGYTATNATYGFVDISGTGTQILVASDDDTLTVDMGMNFSFYGQTYSQTCIGANGLMAFNGCEPGNPAVNFANTPTFNDDPVIAPLNDDWQFFNTANGAEPDAVYYETLGSQFIVQWSHAYGYPSSPGSVTFEAILTQGSNQILFEYLNVDSGDSRAFGGSAVVGIRDTGGDQNGNALVWSFDGSSPIANLSAIEFDPNAAAGTPEPSSLACCGAGAVLMACLFVRRARG